MSLLDFNRDGKVSNFEKAVGMAMLASELERIDGYRKASPLRERRNRAPQPSRPSKLDGAIGVVAIITFILFFVTIVCAVGMTLTEVDTSGMSYEEAVRAIDLKYLPAFVSGIAFLVSMLSLFVLIALAPKYEIGESEKPQG